MCGIAGVLNSPENEQVLKAMLNNMSHRGPDDSGIWKENGCWIGVRRLAVRGGLQQEIPIRLGNGSRVLAFNGEIYRFPERCNIAGAIPTTPAEEVNALLLSESMGREVEGMYAIAELAPEKLTFRRDRFGIKPLFWSAAGKTLAFASETRALRSGARQSPGISRSGVDEILAFGRVLGNGTVYEGIRSFAPASRTSISLDEKDYSALMSSSIGPVSGCNGVADLRSELRASLEACIYTDRTLGVALSGGLDSSILAYELNDLGVENLTTISVHVSGRDDGIRDLSELQLPANGSWKTWRHVNIMVRPEDFPDLLAESVYYLDSPHRMTSAPLYVALARGAAKAGIVVLLTGEGPDELFFGYETYTDFVEALLRKDYMPNPEQLITALQAFACPLERHQLLCDILPPDRLDSALGRFRAIYGSLTRFSPMDALRQLEFGLSLEPLLIRADHCLMRYGIEGRTPFLHAGIPALAARWSSTEAVRKGGSKSQLRQAWRGLLATQRLEQKKSPFRAPLAQWHRSQAAGWMEQTLSGAEIEFKQLGLSIPIPEQIRRMGSTEAGVSLLFTLCTLILWSRQYQKTARVN